MTELAQSWKPIVGIPTLDDPNVVDRIRSHWAHQEEKRGIKVSEPRNTIEDGLLWSRVTVLESAVA